MHHASLWVAKRMGDAVELSEKGGEGKEGQKHVMLIQCYEEETLRDVEMLKKKKMQEGFFFLVVGSACRNRRIQIVNWVS